MLSCRDIVTPPGTPRRYQGITHGITLNWRDMWHVTCRWKANVARVGSDNEVPRSARNEARNYYSIIMTLTFNKGCQSFPKKNRLTFFFLLIEVKSRYEKFFSSLNFNFIFDWYNILQYVETENKIIADRYRSRRLISFLDNLLWQSSKQWNCQYHY